MKIALSGKGGVGKTTLSAMLAAALSLRGGRVIALDADPDSNLAAALGMGADEQPKTLSEMTDLIKERTGATDSSSYFQLNPKVDDIPDEYAVKIGNIQLLGLGGVNEGGGGCICPASALVKALLTHLILGRDDHVVMDMEAGIEHLGRATAQTMDALVIVVNEGAWSIQTALRVRKLAGDLGMRRLFAVLNRASETTDVESVRAALGEVPLIGVIPEDARLSGGVVRTDGDGKLLPTEALQDHLGLVEDILAQLEAAAG